MINETLLEFIDRTICNTRTDRRIAELSLNLSPFEPSWVVVPYDVHILPPLREAIGGDAISKVVCDS
jgi:hypothetical protein